MASRTYTDSDLVRVVPESYSFSEVARKLNLARSGSVSKYVKQNIQRLGLDISHFDPHKGVREANAVRPLKREDVLVLRPTDSCRVGRSTLHKALQAAGVEYKCESCDQEAYWQGQELTLEIDHISGEWWDNRPENLRYLCPNCHSQTDTYGGKGRKTSTRVKPICGCGREMWYTSTACFSCTDYSSPSKIEWPSPEDVFSKVVETSYTQASRDLGVSVAAIKKFLKRQGFEPPIKNRKR